MTRTLVLLMPLALVACDESQSVPDPLGRDPAPESDRSAPEPEPEPFDHFDERGEVRQGMTWRLKRRYPDQEAVLVGCGGEPDMCDPYVGDMGCDARLPLLCFQPLDAPLPDGLTEPNRYNRWSGGAVRLSRAVSPVEDGLDTVADASAICADAFGPEWRIADFHDAWAWNFSAFGVLAEIEPMKDRFWVHIGDQPDGICWAR